MKNYYNQWLNHLQKSAKITFTLFLLCALISLSKSQPSVFNPTGIGGGGAQYSPSINPLNSNEIYVACDMSDLFHTTDGGNTWNIINFNDIESFHASMVQFTDNNSIRYCQSINEISDNYFPVKSVDGGNTWQPTTDPTGGNGSWYCIANPQDSNQLIVSDYYNFYFSNDGGTNFSSSFYNANNDPAGAYIAGTFFDGLNIYICTDSGLIVSTNGGTNWSGHPTASGIGATEGIVSFSGAKSGNTTRFICVTMTESDLYVGITGDNNYAYVNVYSMDYGSGKWVKKTIGITSNDLPFFVSMASNNINVAYLAGNDGNTQYPMVMKTSNAGASWDTVFKTNTNYNVQTGYCGINGDFGWDWDQYAFGLNVSPSDTSVVVLTGEGFSHKTTDGGKTWQDVYVLKSELNPADAPTPQGLYYHGNGMEVTSCWDVMWYDSLKMFAGYSDIQATRTNDGGQTWSFNYSGLNQNTAYFFQKNPINGALYAATSSVHDMYQSTRLTDASIDGGSGAIMISTDTGKTWKTMFDAGHPVIWLTIDPTNSDRMYASVINHSGGGNAGGIWVSDNIQLGTGSTWSHCTNPSRTQGHPFNIRVLNDGTLLASYSGRINPSGKFTDSSGVFMSTDHGNTWSDRSDPGMLYWTMDLVIDPYDTAQNTWFACVFSGWGGNANNLGGLYRTTNRGSSWTRINNLLYVSSLTFDPNNNGNAYMSTQTYGLQFTSDINAATPAFTEVSGYPFNQPDRVYFNPYNPNEVWVISFGNGIRKGNLIISGDKEISSKNEEARVYPNPTSGIFTLQWSIVSGQSSVGQIEIFNVLGMKIFSKEIITSGSQFSIDLSTQPDGIYLYRIVSGQDDIIGNGKIVIDR